MDNKKELIRLMERHFASIVVKNETDSCLVDCVNTDDYLVYYRDENGNKRQVLLTNIDDVLNIKVGKSGTIGEMVENGADCWED